MAKRTGPLNAALISPERRRPGRPREEGVDEKILDAALHRLVRYRYAQLRVDDVAADAGVAKTTLYRRWPSKEVLVAHVMRRLYLDRAQADDHGTLRDDLLALLRETYELLFEGPGRVIEDLVRESGASRELAEVVRSTTDARRRAFHQAMNRAVARGELAPTVDHDLVIDLLLGPLWTRLLVSDARMTRTDVETIVDAVLSGVTGPAGWAAARLGADDEGPPSAREAVIPVSTPVSPPVAPPVDQVAPVSPPAVSSAEPSAHDQLASS